MNMPNKMLNKNIQTVINKAVENILLKMSSDSVLEKLAYKHSRKIHFIPKSYRIFGGILQSMNIQFGNFIEELISLLISNESDYKILNEYSRNKSNKFSISLANEVLIDSYITDCQTKEDGFCNWAFPSLQNKILADKSEDKHIFKHDIDLLFKSKKQAKYYYVEIKYNDDHDTGKFVDINRKFIKTYAYLVNELNIKKSSDLVPMLFFFNNKKMKGNPYVPESTNIKRGAAFFDEFLQNVSYESLNTYMTNLSESDEVKEMFDSLYKKIIKQGSISK